MDLTPFQPMKLLRHSARIEEMLRGAVVYPVSVEFDLSNVCPHNCGFCSFAGYRKERAVHLPTDRAIALISELADLGVKSITFTGGGEPLIHPDCARIFEHATGLVEWGVVTNGLALKGSARDAIAAGAKFVRVSLDAGCAATHQVTHGTPNEQFHRILDQILETRGKAPDLTIGCSFCVTKANWREVYQAAKLAREHGANYLEVRPTFPTDWRGDGWNEALTDEEVESAKTEIEHARIHLNGPSFRVIGMVERFDRLAQPTKQYRACRIGPLTTIIGADGNVWHCCVQRGREGFCVGSVLDRPFRDVWMSETHQALMREIDVSRCPRCRYDSYNELLEHAFIGDALHAAFV